jgi:hypothetical protein
MIDLVLVRLSTLPVQGKLNKKMLFNLLKRRESLLVDPMVTKKLASHISGPKQLNQALEQSLSHRAVKKAVKIPLSAISKVCCKV